MNKPKPAAYTKIVDEHAHALSEAFDLPCDLEGLEPEIAELEPGSCILRARPITENETLDVNDLYLESIEEVCIPAAKKAFIEGDANAFVRAGYSSRACLTIVADNVDALLEKGIYEEALVAGYTGGKTNHSHIEFHELEELFDVADPEKLRHCGEPLQIGKTYKLYRGVSEALGPSRIFGFSWTSELALACVYALPASLGCIYEAECHESDILCFTNARDENEFIVLPKEVRKLDISESKIERLANEENARRRQRFEMRIKDLQRN